jgi:crotonobetainyl-CoA:carnitine CoA-transferase CaiB-like acyl-CoA transferase
MTQVMKGVRILEVAQFTFVPAAGAVLADWGADVIKIEHPVRGDTQRGFVNVAGQKVAAFAKKPFEYWRQHLKTYTGQWAPFQSLLDLATDEQALANDMIIDRRRPADQAGPPAGPVQPRGHHHRADAAGFRAHRNLPARGHGHRMGSDREPQSRWRDRLIFRQLENR